MIIPFPLGAIKATLTVVELDTDAELIVGALVFVVTIFDALDAIDEPLELVAVIENVYIVFGVNPNTTIGEDVPVAISPKLLVTVYPVIVSFPPLGAIKATLTVVELDTDAELMVGVFGVVVTDAELDETDVPPELVAVTVKV